MEKLNDYLKQLLSSCSDELRLEPDRNPYLVSDSQTTDVSPTPLPATQISNLVFPLIPNDVKAKLPHQSEIEFTHPHSFGDFDFFVKKSSAGFVVTIRPVVGQLNTVRTQTAVPSAPPQHSGAYATSEPAYSTTAVLTPPHSESEVSYEFESSSFGMEASSNSASNVRPLSELLAEETEIAAEYVPSGISPAIEVVSANDPAYQTVFSDSATFEPPVRPRESFVGEHFTPPPMDIPQQIENRFESDSFTEPPPPVPPMPMEPSEDVPSAAPFVAAEANAGMASKMDSLFHKMANLGASDLHLSVSVPPMVRMDGKMRTLEEGEAPLTAASLKELLTSIMPSKNQQEFAERNDTDFAYEIAGLARFRCNVFMDRKGMGGVFRIIPADILTAEQLGLSKAIMDLTTLSKGLVVVTGPTGSGKSTTLCAMVDSINKNREDHIITIEDPIEFTHENQKCLVNQREVHNHTDSFKDALRAALREDPDILLVGEMRDLETISIAIETAETGHLVFGTLHTTTAASTVDRIIDQFPADRQQQVRVMLSESLRGVIAQTLLPKKGGGRVAALEVLIITPAISNLIREGKTFQIPSAMQTGKQHGMVMLNDALFEHVKNGLVEPMDAYIKAVDKTTFATMLERGGFKL